MGKLETLTLQGDVLTVQPYREDHGVDSGRTFLLQVANDAASSTLLASLPLLDRLLSEKITAVRERRLEEMIEFMAARMVAPSAAEAEMAQRLALCYARILNEYGFFTAEQLADINHSRADNRSALADNWRKRGQVFAVPHPERGARDRDVFPAFQFRDGKPIKIVQQVLEAFGNHKTAWKQALWFTSSNGWLPNSQRPVDLLVSDPQAVLQAARREVEGT